MCQLPSVYKRGVEIFFVNGNDIVISVFPKVSYCI